MLPHFGHFAVNVYCLKYTSFKNYLQFGVQLTEMTFMNYGDEYDEHNLGEL